MRLASLVAAAVLAALAGCDSTPFKRSEPRYQQPPPIQQQMPQFKQEEATPRFRAELHTDLAAGYFERGQYDVALEELGEALRNDATYPKLYSVYGMVYAELGDDPKAELNFRKGLELAPADSEIRHNWGWYLCTHGRPRESISEFEAALRNPLYRTPEIALINAGKCSVEAGDNAAADQYLRRALVLKPGNPVAAYNLALLSYRNNRLEESRALMRFVMAQNPPPPEALYLGMCIERKLADKQSEESYTMQLRNRYPQSSEARAIVGGSC